MECLNPELKLKKWNNAEHDASISLRIESFHKKSWNRRAIARSALGFHRLAVRDLKMAVGCALSIRCNTFNIQVDLNKALEKLKTSMKKAPKRNIIFLIPEGSKEKCSFVLQSPFKI